MLSKTLSYVLCGIEGLPVQVECDLSKGLPRFDIVGLPDTAVKESKERVKAAIKNAGKEFPIAVITVNLAPAEVKKEGSHLDLPIAIAIIKATSQGYTRDIEDTVILGELSLDGTVRPITGVLPMVLSAKKNNIKRVILPCDNVEEASYVYGIDIIGVKDINDVCNYLAGEDLPLAEHKDFIPKSDVDEVNDLKYVKGQYVAKRAIEIAVSGGHNAIMVGAPGAGKTMLAKCIPSIMPDLTFSEALETTAVHSIAGLLSPSDGIVKERPFITPHHTATSVSVIGGGQGVKPGLISLAHNGVLFLDEMPEYPRSTLECLRQPLEDGVVTVSRAKGSIKYPSRFMLIASMNPCPCGNLGSETQLCKCTDTEIRKYKARISGPLLDRIDLHVHVDTVKYDDLAQTSEEENSQQVRKRVNKARLIQLERFKDDGIVTNAQMGEKHLAKYCKLDKECEDILRRSYMTLGLSARGRGRILKVARTIADLDYSENIQKKHLLEAIGLRCPEVE